jgi:AcrR family transcriptional regulator
MARKGLNHDVIMDTATALVEEKGYDNFSLRELAARLSVQPASLYNHIKGLDEIRETVAVRAAEMLHTALTEAMDGKDNDEAFLDGVYSYRDFTEMHPELYKALIHIPPDHDEQIRKASFYSFEPLRIIVNSYGLGHPDSIHFTRSLRSFIHGFAELSGNGLMQRSPASKEETFEFAVRHFLNFLKEHSSHE